MKRYCPKCFSRYEQDLERCPEDNEKLVLISEDDLVGKILDERYEILSKLGEGGMGAVYVAEQAIIGRKVALKVLRGAMVQDESSVKRFLTEAKAIATLKSPHTITLHDFGVTREGQLYYTMEMLEGAPLSKVIRQEAPMDATRSGRFILQACKSLDEAHKKDILHRDIKPDNIFLTWGNDGEHITVLDFGIAKLGEDPVMGTITKTGMLCGTPAYLSPEQAQGYAAVPASDLYALAIVFYEMLAGEPPFSDTTAMRVLMKHVHDEPAPVSVKNPKVEVPVSIEEFLIKGLAKKPEDRFESVREFRSELKRALAAAAMSSETASMPSLGTSVEGLRSITAPLDDGAIDSGVSVDPMGHTIDSSQALRIATDATESGDPPPTAAATPEPAQVPTVPDPAPAEPPPPPPESRTGSSTTGREISAPGEVTAAFAAEVQGRRKALWIGIAGLALFGAVLGLWRPWEAGPGAPPSPAEPAVPVGGPLQSETTDVADVIAAPRGDVAFATAPPPAPDVVDAVTAEDVALATAPLPDAAAEPEQTDQISEIAVAAQPPDAAVVPDAPTAVAGAEHPTDPRRERATDDAAAAAENAEKEKRRAEVRRKRRLAAKRAAAKKAADEAADAAADEAAAKMAAEAEAAAKKAAEAEAAEKKAAEAEAAAKKAAEVETGQTGLGFRKVTVEDPSKDPTKEESGSGLGFRKVNVEGK